MNPGAGRSEAIRLASGNGHLKIVERLLEDSRVNPAENFPFVLHQKIDTLKLLKGCWKI